jgi:hypothetical protein
MTFNVAASLLHRAANGAELLQILDRLAEDEADANIADAAAHFEPIQF